MRYAVEKRLGQGGMATVDLAEDTELGRRVAVKRLFASLANDYVFQQRFFREAKLAAALSHPNLVAVYDVGEDEGLPYIVMEYVDGETLAELMRREGPLPPDRAVDLLLQVCAGLEHAHAAGLVHRDIKPQNLLVRRDGVAKIADFGIARTIQSTQLTQVGTVLGTAAYLAPEQAMGEQVTAAADIYSVGAVGYELLTGRTPYEFETLTDLTLKQQEPPPPIPEVPPHVDAAIRRCLAFDRARRPASAAALARELGGSAAVAEPEPPTEVLPTSPAPRRLHVPRRALIAVGVLAALAIFGTSFAIAYTRGDGGGSPPPVRQPPPSPPPAGARPELVPRGRTPEESARLLAQWLRERRSG
jgi:eukaryotic-like serine/threonine-protein kinase